MALLYSGSEFSPSLSGGMQLKTSDFLRRPEECILILNCLGDRIGSQQKRPGYDITDAAVNASQDILGIHPYYQANGTRRLLAVANGANAALHRWNETSWASIGGGLQAGARFYFEDFLDSVFFVGADSSNNYQATSRVNGTTIDTVNLTNAPRGKYIQRYIDRLYIANVSVSGTRYPSRVYFSSIPTASGALTWSPTTNYISVPEDTNEEITGLAENNNRLVIFKERSMWRYDTSSLVQISNTGCVSQATIQNHDNVTYFFNRDGIFRYAGGQPKKISGKIDPVIRAIPQTQLASAVAEVDDDHYYLFVGDVTVPLPVTDTIALTNVWIVYTISTNTWYLYSSADAISAMGHYIDTSSRRRIYLGTTSGSTNSGTVFRFTQDGDGIRSDHTSDIQAIIRYRTYIGAPEEKKRIQDVYTFMDRAIGSKFRLRADNALQWNRENQITKFVQKFPVLIEGNVFDFELIESSSNTPFVFHGFGFNLDTVTKK